MERVVCVGKMLGGDPLSDFITEGEVIEAVAAMRACCLPCAGNIVNFEYYRRKPDGLTPEPSGAISGPAPHKPGEYPPPPAIFNLGLVPASARMTAQGTSNHGLEARGTSGDLS